MHMNQDKTGFIKEWWETQDEVTLITRPRRFGKTLTVNMVERFFSVKYAGRGEVFRGLEKLVLTNREVKVMFRNMIRGWFRNSSSKYNDFIRALLKNDLKAMNAYMNRVALTTFSFFDSGNRPSEQTEPERFYHGFVLGLMVELAGRYALTSNRESGFGRYDVMLEPLNASDDAIIMEFKVFDPTEEKTLEDTVRKAHEQIENRNYAAALIAKGVSEEHIRSYGFAFRGKTVLIG